MFLFVFVAAAAAQERSKMILTNLGREDIALYHLGAAQFGVLDGSETLCATISPGGEAGRYVALNDSFAVRSGDMQWRSRLTIYAHDDPFQPFKISFHNAMVDEGPEPIELQHHEEGFIWIEPNHYLTHATVAGHKFILKDKLRRPRFSVEIHLLDRTEL